MPGWDPRKHPRNRLGRWREVVDALTDEIRDIPRGDHLDVPTAKGTLEISRQEKPDPDEWEYTVKSNDGKLYADALDPTAAAELVAKKTVPPDPPRSPGTQDAAVGRITATKPFNYVVAGQDYSVDPGGQLDVLRRSGAGYVIRTPDRTAIGYLPIEDVSNAGFYLKTPTPPRSPGAPEPGERKPEDWTTADGHPVEIGKKYWSSNDDEQIEITGEKWGKPVEQITVIDNKTQKPKKAEFTVSGRSLYVSEKALLKRQLKDEEEGLLFYKHSDNPADADHAIDTEVNIAMLKQRLGKASPGAPEPGGMAPDWDFIRQKQKEQGVLNPAGTIEDLARAWGGGDPETHAKFLDAIKAGREAAAKHGKRSPGAPEPDWNDTTIQHFSPGVDYGPAGGQGRLGTGFGSQKGGPINKGDEVSVKHHLSVPGVATDIRLIKGQRYEVKGVSAGTLHLDVNGQVAILTAPMMGNGEFVHHRKPAPIQTWEDEVRANMRDAEPRAPDW